MIDLPYLMMPIFLQSIATRIDNTGITPLKYSGKSGQARCCSCHSTGRDDQGAQDCCLDLSDPRRSMASGQRRATSHPLAIDAEQQFVLSLGVGMRWVQVHPDYRNIPARSLAGDRQGGQDPCRGATVCSPHALDVQEVDDRNMNIV
ncbi:hypothetical protein [Lichenicola sp.]|uniref:hypothetical protein n=1 Tax=Lichenicola sp. TaxID=2804529 RepID=UPI003B00BD2F